jgi:hypothetical protein
MKMRHLCLLLLLLASCSRESKLFPELVPSGGLPDGYSWELSNGPDFYVYNGVKSNSNSGVGIYFGMHPQRGDEPPVRIEKGSIGPVPVQWHILDGSTNYYASFYRRCLVPYRPSRKHERIALHGWVFADSEAEAATLQQNLKNLVFTETTYEERMRKSEQSPEPDL